MRRLIVYAGCAVAVEYEEQHGAQLVDFLFRQAPQQPDLPPEVVYRLRWFEASGKLGLYRGDLLIYLGTAEGALAELLQGEVCRHLAERGHGGLLFHAACVADGARAIILPGESAAGKSTLAAWLTTQGYGYLSDELAFIPQGSLEVQPLIRPLSLKQPAQVVLAPYLDWEALQPHLLLSGGGWLLAPEALGAPVVRPSWALQMILLPRYQPESDLLWRRLSGGAAVTRLFGSLVNGAQLPERGFSELARLCRQIPAYELVYGRFAQLEQAVSAGWHLA